MKWSYSGGRSFRACQRQWYFHNIVGLGQARAPERRRVYLLGKTDSISGWRGRLVDKLITEDIVARQAQGREFPTYREILAIARQRFDKELAFARVNSASDLGVDTKNPYFALFRDDEHHAEADFDRAWEEVQAALRTLYQTDVVKQLIRDADLLVAQRPLQFKILDDVTVTAVPDLLVFETGCQPAIIDWKVHAQGTHDAWMQLATYAIAIERCTSHRDWQDFFDGIARTAETIRLIEVQLLTGAVREHRLTEDDVAAAEDFMETTAYEMACLVDDRKHDELNAEDFLQARSPEACDSCGYRPLCRETVNAD
ncbi:PD-(D/E)XK nuclease family protein [Shinella zoogloeoides]